MPVQSRLFRLVLVTCLLGVAAAALAAWFVYDRQSRATEQSLAQSAQAVAQLVDNELAGYAETLRVLSGTASLQRNDLATFYVSARNAAAAPDSTVVLLRPDGEQVINTRRPLGAPLPSVNVALRDLRLASRADAVIVSNLFTSQLTHKPEFAVQVPVVREGRIAYYLNRGLPAASLGRLLKAQGFPAAWRLAVVDRDGRVVARSSGQESYVGKLASDALRSRMRTETFGTNDGTTLDGIPVRAFFRRAPWSNWTVILSVPVAELRAPAREAALLLAGLIALLLGGALLAARHVARQIAA
ncbi:hybrid sensor histidine kinase/response regulator, partial [Massilia arenosa]